MKKLKDYKQTRIKIGHIGAIEVSNAYVFASGKSVAIAVDMKSKRGELDSISEGENGEPAIWVSAIEDSVRLNKSVDKDEPTEIIFLDYKGWEVWSADVGKNTIRVCLIKQQ